MSIRSTFSRIKDRYIRFAEKQGFAIITVVCVAVITATAVWSKQEEVYVAPTPPVSYDVSVAQLQQQSLRDVATPSPSPKATPRPWNAPMDDTAVVRPFSTASMVQSSVTGIWSIHDSVDLAASPGQKIYAIGDGVVLSAGNDALQGAWLLIDHGDGIEALYAGLAMTAAYVPDDKVFAGDVIGYAGKGPLDETDLTPHLHLRVKQDSQAIDPTTLWSQSSE